MSYARMGSSGHYIYHDDTTNEFIFNCYHTVSDDEMAVFLYKIFLTRPEEFKQWVNKGRDIVFEWLNKSDNKEEKEYRQWLLEKEKENEHYKNFMK